MTAVITEAQGIMAGAEIEEIKAPRGWLATVEHERLEGRVEMASLTADNTMTLLADVVINKLQERRMSDYFSGLHNRAYTAQVKDLAFAMKYGEPDYNARIARETVTMARNAGYIS